MNMLTRRYYNQYEAGGYQKMLAELNEIDRGIGGRLANETYVDGAGTAFVLYTYDWKEVREEVRVTWRKLQDAEVGDRWEVCDVCSIGKYRNYHSATVWSIVKDEAGDVVAALVHFRAVESTPLSSEKNQEVLDWLIYFVFE